MTNARIGAVILAALTLGGAGFASAQTAAVRTPDNNPPSGWPAPVVLMTSPPTADGSELVWSWVSGAGMVEATRKTTAGIGRPLPAPASGGGAAVEPCRTAAWNDAVRMGARDIEAVPAGAARRDRWGRIVIPVHMRLTYARNLGWEIREGVMTCTVDAKGNVVAATM